MSSFDKIVKLACKPKPAPPKAKYIDPIIAATWSDDGAVSDVCKALIPRIREPNHIVVFKALIVLHTMIRNGSTDNVLSYLSQADILRLKNVSAVNWEGYSAPENLQHYATYLESRIRAYRELKHDAIRVQSDTNRDMRNSMSIDEELQRTKKPRNNDKPSLPTRSKTLVGRKLRSMTVEKGLLRETKIVHSMIDALVECRFYLDDLEDELNITALRMLVKDLLILFQAGNEGVINVLEHYFEMSHIDAEDALKIYRHFCSQTEKVVEFLGVAKKLQNLLNVPIPNLKHAPVSLAGALQEYLDDPNFEQNRIEYRANKQASDRSTRRPTDSNEDKSNRTPSVTFQDSSAASESSASTATATASSSAKKDVTDFFSSIEEQQPMFSPSQNSPAQPLQGPGNPFSQMLNGQQQLAGIPQITTQPTGFLVPQHTATPGNPFGQFLTAQQPQQQTLGTRPFSTFIPQQQTGFIQQPQQQPTFLLPRQTGFLQPQATGVNPFRQSMLLPQTTGMALFANQHPTGTSNQAGSFGQNLFVNVPTSPPSAPPTASQFPNNTSTFGQPSTSASLIAPAASTFTPSTNQVPVNVPNRPASTPLTSMTNPLPNTQPVKTHQTGTKNPFGPVITTAPPVPKVPTLMDLAMGKQMSQQTGQQPNGETQPGSHLQQPQSAQPQQPQQTGGFNWANSSLNPGATNISSIASSFTKIGQSNTGAGFSTTATQSSSPTTSALSSASASAGSALSPSSLTTTPSIAPLNSQITGFAGLKPFKPTSSFGASLMESLPPSANDASNTPISGSSTPSAFSSSQSSGLSATTFTNNNSQQSTSTPAFGALNAQPTGLTGGFKPTSAFGASLTSASQTGVGLRPQMTGSQLGVGLRPQITGGGAANPFRASMAAGVDLSSFGSSSPAPPVPGLPAQFTGLPFSQTLPFGSSPTPFSSGFNPNQAQNQQNQPASLI